MTTQDGGSVEREGRPLLPADDPAELEAGDDQATKVPGFREHLEVPVAYASIDPLTWEDEEHVFQSLQCVTVDANLGLGEFVSVAITSFENGSGDSEGHRGMVYLDLTPSDALLLADELQRTAAESVAGFPARRWRGTALARSLKGRTE